MTPLTLLDPTVWTPAMWLAAWIGAVSVVGVIFRSIGAWFDRLA
jgi:hypothetical protein